MGTCLFSFELTPSGAEGVGRLLVDLVAADVLLQLVLGADAVRVLIAEPVRMANSPAPASAKSPREFATEKIVSFYPLPRYP